MTGHHGKEGANACVPAHRGKRLACVVHALDHLEAPSDEARFVELDVAEAVAFAFEHPLAADGLDAGRQGHKCPSPV